MAGAGSRFATKGYKLPKPLIDVDGMPMIQRVIENIALDGQYIFVVQKEHCEKYGVDSILKNLKPDCKIVKIEGVTEGAACTTLLAKKYIDSDVPLLMANSDQWVDWSPEHFIDYTRRRDCDGAMLTFPSDLDRFSYAKIDNDGYVTETAEKLVISSHATVGLYYWKSGKEYVECAEEMIRRNIRSKGEFYVCPVYNILFERNGKSIIYPVPRMLSLGTPEELNYFLEKNNSEKNVVKITGNDYGEKTKSGLRLFKRLLGCLNKK